MVIIPKALEILKHDFTIGLMITQEAVTQLPTVGFDPTVIAAAAVTVIAAVTASIVTIVNAISSANDRRLARTAREILQTSVNDNTRKTETIIEKAVEIHTLTNSNLSKVTSSLDVALAKISGLEKLISELTSAKRIADDLAISKIIEIKSTEGNEPILQDIKDNTANTVNAVEKLNTKVLKIEEKKK